MSRDNRPPGQRQLRVGEELRHALAHILERGELRDPLLAATPVTVTEVRVSPDLRQARVYVMPLGGQEAEAALADLRRNQAEIRHLVARGLELKYAPQLRFALDETFDRMDDTRRMLAQPQVRRDVDADEDEAGDDAEG